MSADRNVSNKAYDEAVRRSFRSIASELEKVTAERDELRKLYENRGERMRYSMERMSEFYLTTDNTIDKLEAERDELLKGYRGMRQWITKCSTVGDPISGNALRRESSEILTSFPEIK